MARYAQRNLDVTSTPVQRLLNARSRYRVAAFVQRLCLTRCLHCAAMPSVCARPAFMALCERS